MCVAVKYSSIYTITTRAARNLARIGKGVWALFVGEEAADIKLSFQWKLKHTTHKPRTTHNEMEKQTKNFNFTAWKQPKNTQQKCANFGGVSSVNCYYYYY